MYGVRLGLERMHRLLDALGAPQKSVPTVLVGGTNGKGSTATLLAAMCQAAGYKTGLYTSPHLEDVRERIRVDGRALGEAALAGHLDRAIRLAEELQDDPPTYFEALTLTALLHFRDREVDLGIFEVGLGGRLDATNACEPQLALITRISLDHEEQLGTSITAITREKAGIFRRDQPAVAWGEPRDAREALVCEAARLGTRLTFANDSARLLALAGGDRAQSVELTTQRGAYRLTLPLAGRHQGNNLAIAVLGAEALSDLGYARLDESTITTGVSACRWPGRLEWIELPDGRRILLDVAHNPDGIEALACYLEARRAPFDLLFGAFTDKRVDKMLPRISGLAERIVLTTPPGSRASDPRDWKELLPGREATIEVEPGRALDLALEGAASSSLVICGSLYLVGQVRRLLRERFGRPDSALGNEEGES